MTGLLFRLIVHGACENIFGTTLFPPNNICQLSSCRESLGGTSQRPPFDLRLSNRLRFFVLLGRDTTVVSFVYFCSVVYFCLYCLEFTCELRERFFLHPLFVLFVYSNTSSVFILLYVLV